MVNLYLSRTHLYFGGGLKLENGQNKLVIVSSEVLPDIVLKVLAAKRMRARGEVSTSSEACRKVGISRSAYYKYKDSVFNYEEQLTNNIVSVYCILRDEKGVLSSIISRLYELNTNILTINQNIPIDSVATVTFSVRFEHDALSTNVLTEELSKVHGRKRSLVLTLQSMVLYLLTLTSHQQCHRQCSAIQRTMQRAL